MLGEQNDQNHEDQRMDHILGHNWDKRLTIRLHLSQMSQSFYRLPRAKSQDTYVRDKNTKVIVDGARLETTSSYSLSKAALMDFAKSL